MPQRSTFRQQSRRMSLGGVMAALTVVILSLGSLVPLATFACPLLAMVCLIPLVCRYGPGAALTVYAGAGILSLFLCADKELAFLYAFLGWYPALRPLLEGLASKLLRTAVKCLLFSAAMAAMYLLLIFFFRLEAVAADFAEYSALAAAGLLALGNVTFLLFDRALGQLMRLYRWRFLKK